MKNTSTRKKSSEGHVTVRRDVERYDDGVDSHLRMILVSCSVVRMYECAHGNKKK